MTPYLAWIAYQGQYGGDTIVDAPDAGEALRQALVWAKAGTYEAGDDVEVNVMRLSDYDRLLQANAGATLAPEVGTTFKAT